MGPASILLFTVVLAAQEPQAPIQNPSYYFLVGRHLEGEGKVDEAIAAHQQAIALAPDSAELRAELAALYARQDRPVDALETAEEALTRDADNQEANRILGSIYAAHVDRRQPLRPGDDPSQYAARAIAALEKGKLDGVFDVSLDLMLGRLYLQTGAFDKAVPLLRRVADDQPGYAEGALLLALAQETAGSPDDAIATLERALRENPRFYRGLIRVAEIYERQRRWPEAADAFARAQTLNQRIDLTGRRAAALINAGRAAEARDLLETLLGGHKVDSPDPGLQYLLAAAQRAAGDLSAAEATAQKLLSAYPDDRRGLNVLAMIQQDKGDVPGAERTLRELIRRDPVDANSLNSLGYLLAERGERLDEAVELVKRALDVEPANPAFLDSLGWAYFQQGRFELADAPLTEAAEKLKQSSVVQDHLGDLRFRQQRYAEAAAAWERALDGDGVSVDRARIERKLRDARSRLELR
jgi:tetratricopeptide (TPR) repeat protein